MRWTEMQPGEFSSLWDCNTGKRAPPHAATPAELLLGGPGGAGNIMNAMRAQPDPGG